MTGEETLRDLTRKLKANREKVPRDVLKTKYKKPYDELLGQIADAMRRIMRDETLTGLKVKEDDAGHDIAAKIQILINEATPEISAAIFKRYDVDEFKGRVDNLKTAIWNLWIPYWQSFCGLYAAPECFKEPYQAPRIYNELTEEFLVDEEKDIWEKHPEWESEKRCFITAGACHILAAAIKEKEGKDNEQTGKH